ncbi:hypothetical protein RQ359_001406 [Sulfuracidifex metallicus DSM 6482 = JCM 9184]|nr:hypothetical protein RQ359_001406 [Sulfuracidifex metallicus DSM 6482 = JCM 9184]
MHVSFHSVPAVNYHALKDKTSCFKPSLANGIGLSPTVMVVPAQNTT